MKLWYGCLLSCMILLSTLILDASAKFTDMQLARLAQERTINLVIINDVQEYNADYTISQLQVGPMHADCMRALASDQLILCSNLLWISVQNIVAAFNMFYTSTPTYVAIDLNFATYTTQLRTLKNIYDQINIVQSWPESLLTFSHDQKEKQLTALINRMQNVLGDQSIDVTVRRNIQKMFATYMYYESIIRQGYVCKRVTKKSIDFDKQENDFLLFIPKHLQNGDENLRMQDALLGLSWTDLPDYDYKNVVSDHDVQKIMHSVSHARTMHKQGEHLLNALNIIKFKDVVVSREFLPFLNVYLTGHGSKDSLTAEISIVPKKNSDGSTAPSDFVQVLNFFNHHFRTQSLAILSCYPGGKKLIDTYGINNYYSNLGLENISYPLIMIGSTLQEVMGSFIHDTLTYAATVNFASSGLYVPTKFNVIAEYFANLSPSALNYSNAAQVFFENQDIKNIANYVNIKMPYVSWFSAAQYATHVKQLSQVAMSAADKPIVISDHIKVILLEANYIPQPLHVTTDNDLKLPKFFPVNYMNQNYYFDFVVIDKLDESMEWKDVFTKIFVPKIREPVNIFFKRLALKTKILTTVIMFMHQNIHKDGIFLSGYIYTDEHGAKKMAAWESDQDVLPAWDIVEKSFDGDVQPLIDNIVFQTENHLRPALKSEFLAKLNREMAAKKHAKNIDDSNVRWVKEPKTGKWKENARDSAMPK